MSNLKEITKQVSADAAAIMVPHVTEPYLYCKDSYNCPAEWGPLTNPLDNSTANGRVYLSGQPASADHIDVKLAGHLVSSFIIVPIIKGGKTIGNLELIISDKNKTFPKDAQHLIERFADTLADKL